MIMPSSATDIKNRVRVRTTHIALAGGSLALADFHVTPPLGSNIATKPPGPQHLVPGSRYAIESAGFRAVAPSSREWKGGSDLNRKRGVLEVGQVYEVGWGREHVFRN
jgi:hypothetical protein